MLLNIAVIAIIALIAYWWSNQGFLSGLLHLVCVVCAAAFAMAIWEVVYLSIIGTSWWSGLVPGVMLLLAFAVTLAIMRGAADKLAFGNTQIPAVADRIGGGIAGALAGVVTMGMLLIGTGFIDRPHETLGHTGWSRGPDGMVPAVDSDDASAFDLWVPADLITTRLLEIASLGALRPDFSGQPLAKANPHLNRQAALLRDRKRSKLQRFSQMFQPPGTIEVTQPLRISEVPTKDGSYDYLMVPIRIEKTGLDFKRGLAIAQGHIRLVGDTDGDLTVLHPDYWGQNTMQDDPADEDGKGAKIPRPAFFKFDAAEKYIYDIGKKEADARLVFEIPPGFDPDFLQVRGTRFDLEEVRDAEDFAEFADRSFAAATYERAQDWGGEIPKESIDMRGGLPRGARPARGDFRGQIEFDDHLSRITMAKNAVVSNQARAKGGSSLMAKGYALLGVVSEGDKPVIDQTRGIVKIAVGPSTNANILGAARQNGGDGTITLFTADGSEYEPMGFELKNDNTTTITFNTPITRWSEVRKRPRFGSRDTFNLIFIMPVGASLDRLMLDDVRIGFFENITVEPPSRR